MKKRCVQIIALFLVLQLSTCVDPELEDECEKKGGYCRRFVKCNIAKEMLKNGERPIPCGFDEFDDQPWVCCISEQNIRVETEVQPISQKLCKDWTFQACNYMFVYVGVAAAPGEFPFMALIGYGPDEDISWQCGGSIISPRYILSAAHCDVSNEGSAKWVRVGELDLSTNTEKNVPIDARIVARFVHPGYKPPAVYNDIVLFRINKRLLFDSYVRPVCLQPIPSNDLKKAWIAGWGRTDFIGPISSKLLKAEVDVLPHSRCKKHESDRNQLPKGYNSRSMICARSEEKGSDTCQGDSGGALFLLPEKNCALRTQLGVTSFGRDCGNPDFPGVYTNISHYIDWIEPILWPNNSEADVNLVWES